MNNQIKTIEVSRRDFISSIATAICSAHLNSFENILKPALDLESQADTVAALLRTTPGARLLTLAIAERITGFCRELSSSNLAKNRSGNSTLLNLFAFEAAVSLSGSGEQVNAGIISLKQAAQASSIILSEEALDQMSRDMNVRLAVARMYGNHTELASIEETKSKVSSMLSILKRLHMPLKSVASNIEFLKSSFPEAPAIEVFEMIFSGRAAQISNLSLKWHYYDYLNNHNPELIEWHKPSEVADRIRSYEYQLRSEGEIFQSVDPKQIERERIFRASITREKRDRLRWASEGYFTRLPQF